MKLEDKLSIARASNNALNDEIKGLQKYIMNLKPYCNNCRNDGEEDICDECHRKQFMWEHKRIFKE